MKKIIKNRLKDTEANTIQKKLSKKYYKKISLKNRLIILFIALLTISVVAVGMISYGKSSQMTIEKVENRLQREVELMDQIASNLKFLYVGDDAYFMQQLEINVRSQRKQLEMEGMESDYFYIENKEVNPFKISKKNHCPIFRKRSFKPSKKKKMVSFTQQSIPINIHLPFGHYKI